MTGIQALLYVLVALAGTGVVLTREPVNQALVFSLFGMTLSLLFLGLQAPDVALSEITIGAAVLPLILLVTTAKAKSRDGSEKKGREKK